jgi:predicted Mrr-cat superfamily restriction endonuclease
MSYVVDSDKRQAYIVKISRKYKRRLLSALVNNVLNIGWSKARGLTDENLSYEEFREIIHQAYYSKDSDYRRSGRVAASIWRFIRDIKIGNYILAPTTRGFFVGVIKSEAYFKEDFTDIESGYKRNVEWLRKGKAIIRRRAPPKLRKRFRTAHMISDAKDLMQEIEFVLRAVE